MKVWLKFLKNFPEYRKAVSKVFEALKDAKILGEEGITSTYFINKDGYMVEQKHAIDIEIDFAQWQKAVLNLENIDLEAEKLKDKISLVEKDLNLEEKVEDEEDVDGKIKLGINFETSIYNINQEIDIEIPEITKKTL